MVLLWKIKHFTHEHEHFWVVMWPFINSRWKPPHSPIATVLACGSLNLKTAALSGAIQRVQQTGLNLHPQCVEQLLLPLLSSNSKIPDLSSVVRDIPSLVVLCAIPATYVPLFCPANLRDPGVSKANQFSPTASHLRLLVMARGLVSSLMHCDSCVCTQCWIFKVFSLGNHPQCNWITWDLDIFMTHLPKWGRLRRWEGETTRVMNHPPAATLGPGLMYHPCYRCDRARQRHRCGVLRIGCLLWKANHVLPVTFPFCFWDQSGCMADLSSVLNSAVRICFTLSRMQLIQNEIGVDDLWILFGEWITPRANIQPCIALRCIKGYL